MKNCIACLFAMSAFVAQAELVAYWNFDLDPQGITDASGYGHSLTNNGVQIIDGAAYFDGDPHILNSQGLPLWGSVEPYTIECFVKCESPDAIILELSPNANDSRYSGSFFISSKEGSMNKTLWGGWNGRKYENSIVGDGQWHHLAVVFTPGNYYSEETLVVEEQHKFYVDGVLQPMNNNFLGGNVGLWGWELYIGSRNNSQYVFKGMIDDVRITRGVLTTDQFMKVRSAPGNYPVVAYYPFNHDNPFNDASGNGHDLAGSSVNFDNDCADIRGAHQLNTIDPIDLTGCEDFTVEYFVRMHDRYSSAVQMLLEFSPNVNGNIGSFFSTLNDYGVGSISGACRIPYNYHIDKSDSWEVNTGWHHVAMVRTKNNTGSASWLVYLDGVQQSQRWDYVGDATGQLGSHRLYIGSRNNAELWSDVDLDDVKITAKALAPGEFMKARSGAEP